MIVWRLVLRDGEVINFGEAWKDPDGSPAKAPTGNTNPDGTPEMMALPLRVGGIFLEPEQLISSDGDDNEELLERLEKVAEQTVSADVKALLEEVVDRLEDSGDGDVETHPPCYLVFARPDKGSPLEESKETRVRRIPVDMVKYAEEAWQSEIASSYIAEALADMYNLTPSNGAAAAPAAAQQAEPQPGGVTRMNSQP